MAAKVVTNRAIAELSKEWMKCNVLIKTMKDEAMMTGRRKNRPISPPEATSSIVW